MRLAMLILATVTVIVVIAFDLSKVAGVIGFVAVSLPVVLFDVFRPPLLDCEKADGELMFEFRDPEYAAEFAQLNGAELEEL